MRSRARAVSLCVLLTLSCLSIAARPQQAPANPEYDSLFSKWTGLSETDLDKEFTLMGERLSTEVGRSANVRGIEAYRRMDFETALSLYRLTRKIGERIGDPGLIANADSNSGIVYSAAGQHELALELYAKSLAANKELGRRVNAASVLNSIAIVRKAQGEYILALEAWQEALQLNEAEGNRIGVAQTVYNMANANLELGYTDLALQQYHKSLQLSEEAGNELGQSYGFSSLGSLYHEQRNFTLARDYHQKALNLKRKVGNSSEIALTLSSLGLTYKALGRIDAAEESFREAMALNEKTGDRRALGRTLVKYGTLLQSVKKLDEASERLRQSLAYAESFPDRLIVAEALSRLAENSALRNDGAAALDYANRALSVSREAGLVPQIARAATVAGATLRKLGRLEEARTALDEAIAAQENLRDQTIADPEQRALYFEDKSEPYHQMTELLLAQNNPAEALGFAERAKARALLDTLQPDKAGVTKNLSAEEQRKERELLNRLSEANLRLREERKKARPNPATVSTLAARVDDARIKHEELRSLLYATHPELRAFRGELRSVSVSDAAGLLPDSRTLLLEYVATSEGTYLFTIAKSGSSPQGVAAHKLKIDSALLETRVENLREMIATRDPEFRNAASSLYGTLLGPVAADLNGKTRLVIIPDGVLWDVPFQLLLSKRARYVLEDFDISYAPSIAALREMSQLRRTSTSGPPTLLAFGNPAGANLPNSEREVLALRDVYGETRSRIYIGAEAVEEKFKAESSGFQVLHVATHGIFDDSKPLYSHLMMSPGKSGSGDDGMLEAREMMDLDLKADLVVLSACETGRGRSGGEGLIGMSWALFVAGTPAVVTSHWKVESASTTDLMIDFHRTLKSSNISPAGALRQAALRILRRPEYRHPYYWSGFSVVGYGL